uniref:Uncharacterized protein n=1 Tax=Nothoprocta perdicaria TaxID=30464 RepID=A0A8C6YQ92_NOTPE
MAAQGEYQRLEDEEDSPPGEEELLLHVTEGLQDSWHHIKNLDNFFTKISLRRRTASWCRRSSCSWWPSAPSCCAACSTTCSSPTGRSTRAAARRRRPR